jgi:hypothetical protein
MARTRPRTLDRSLELLGSQCYIFRSLKIWSPFRRTTEFFWLLFLDEGGDDLKLKAWDIRQGFAQPTFVNKK